MTRYKILVVNMSIVIFSVATLGLFLEIGLAILGINTKSHIRFVLDKGTTHVPHAYYRHTKEGFSEGYFNSHGFRDYERTHEKPENSFRILVFGDSYVEGLQVSLDKTFPALLEKKLNEHSASMRFEVLNLGQSGFGTADAYMRYLNFGVEYSPDLVILAFLTGNDFMNNSKILNKEALAFYFTVNESGSLVLDRSLYDKYTRSLTLPKRLFQSIKRNSYLASLISERLFLWKRQLRESRFRRRFTDDMQRGEKGELSEFSNLNIYVSDPSLRWKEAFDITERLILKFRNSVEERGAKFLLVALSNTEQVHPAVQQEINETHALTFDFELPDRFLEGVARRKEINFLKLLPVFQEYHRKTGIFLHGFNSSRRGHWNEYGHRLGADQIFEFLMKERLVPFDSIVPDLAWRENTDLNKEVFI